jgi:shikimate 5-dehydrogenase
MTNYTPATKPTFYFIGVSTEKSSIMKVFPAWAQHLGLGDVKICGVDFVLHDSAENYRKVIDFLKNDPLSLGALVTTHKLDLFEAAKDMFDVIDPHSELMAETSCLSKRNGKLICHAKDPISSGLAINGFLPDNHFAKTNAKVLSMGAGGSTIALTWHLMEKSAANNRPSKIYVTDRSQQRLDHVRDIHTKIGNNIPCEYIHCSSAKDNERVLRALNPGSLVINATGLGKDAPGSPISYKGAFPKNGVVWELNYRGNLVFLDQANAQNDEKALQVEDGWTYFIHGWTQVIAEVFDIVIPVSGPKFDAIAQIASSITGRTV